MTSLDPVTLALVQNRLDNISQQMGWVMTRTARSPIFNQSHDFSCFLAAPDGTLISQADGIPIPEKQRLLFEQQFIEKSFDILGPNPAP